MQQGKQEFVLFQAQIVPSRMMDPGMLFLEIGWQLGVGFV